MRLPKPPPALVLLLLSPTIGELLSGSSPPMEFFNPFGFTMLVLLYGCGAVIVRELKVRWRKGLGSLLLLGAAYGILEEGLMVCSFFNPAWPDLGSVALYGRFFDVNWFWAEMLTIYHAIYSITIPILLVELAYPERNSESWVENKTLALVFGFLAGDVTLGFFLFSFLFHYRPPTPQYLLAFLAMLLFGYAAHQLPADWGGNGTKNLPRLHATWIIGTSATFVFFFGFWLMPALVPLWPIAMLFGPALIFFYMRIVGTYQWKRPYRKHLFALVSGALTFFIVFAPLQEFDKTRMDNAFGMSFVGLAFLIGLVLLGRSVWKSEQKLDFLS